VRLEGAEAALDNLAPERRDVVVRGELARPGDGERACPRRAAVRPVRVDRVAGGAAEELVHGDAERLRLQIEQRILDPGERLLDHRARALPRVPVQLPPDPLHRARVAADDEWREVLDDAGQASRRAVRVGDLGPADGAVVRGRLEEDPRPPAGVAEQGLEPRDLHEPAAYGSASTGGSEARPLATSCSARSQSSSSSTLNPS